VITLSETQVLASIHVHLAYIWDNHSEYVKRLSSAHLVVINCGITYVVPRRMDATVPERPRL